MSYARAMAAKRLATAGKSILKHLGIDDAALHAFVPEGAPKLRAVFWCQFDSPLTLDELTKALDALVKSGELSRVARIENRKFPPGAPPEGIAVPTVLGDVPGRYVGYMFYGMRDESYEATGRYQLEAAFRGMGTAWGSNQAVYERFKSIALPSLQGTEVTERTQ